MKIGCAGALIRRKRTMKNKERTLSEDVKHWLDPGSIEYSDSFVYADMVKRYGKDAVEEEIRKQNI